MSGDRPQVEVRSVALDTSVVIYQVGPRWNDALPLQAQDNAVGHMRFMAGLVAEGAAWVAGPFTRTDERARDGLVGLLVLNVSAEDAPAVVAGDPAVAGGQLVPKVLALFPLQRRRNDSAATNGTARG